MSEVQQQEQGSDRKHKKVRAKKSSTHVDMTPMVDLAFLLLTFFMLTTTFSKPKTMELNMPDKDPNQQQKVNNALTVLLTDKNQIYYYTGEFKPDSTQLQLTTFDMDKGIHKLLLDLNKPTIDEIKVINDRKERKEIPDSVFKKMKKEAQAKKSALTVLIKTDDKAKYRNAIDMIDELNSCMIGKYALVEMGKEEYDLLQKQTK